MADSKRALEEDPPVDVLYLYNSEKFQFHEESFYSHDYIAKEDSSPIDDSDDSDSDDGERIPTVDPFVPESFVLNSSPILSPSSPLHFDSSERITPPIFRTYSPHFSPRDPISPSREQSKTKRREKLMSPSFRFQDPEEDLEKTSLDGKESGGLKILSLLSPSTQQTSTGTSSPGGGWGSSLSSAASYVSSAISPPHTTSPIGGESQPSPKKERTPSLGGGTGLSPPSVKPPSSKPTPIPSNSKVVPRNLFASAPTSNLPLSETASRPISGSTATVSLSSRGYSGIPKSASGPKVSPKVSASSSSALSVPTNQPKSTQPNSKQPVYKSSNPPSYPPPPPPRRNQGGNSPLCVDGVSNVRKRSISHPVESPEQGKEREKKAREREKERERERERERDTRERDRLSIKRKEYKKKKKTGSFVSSKPKIEAPASCDLLSGSPIKPGQQSPARAPSLVLSPASTQSPIEVGKDETSPFSPLSPQPPLSPIGSPVSFMMDYQSLSPEHFALFLDAVIKIQKWFRWHRARRALSRARRLALLRVSTPNPRTALSQSSQTLTSSLSPPLSANSDSSPATSAPTSPADLFTKLKYKSFERLRNRQITVERPLNPPSPVESPQEYLPSNESSPKKFPSLSLVNLLPKLLTQSKGVFADATSGVKRKLASPRKATKTPPGSYEERPIEDAEERKINLLCNDLDKIGRELEEKDRVVRKSPNSLGTVPNRRRLSSRNSLFLSPPLQSTIGNQASYIPLFGLDSGTGETDDHFEGRHKKEGGEKKESSFSDMFSRNLQDFKRTSKEGEKRKNSDGKEKVTFSPEAKESSSLSPGSSISRKRGRSPSLSAISSSASPSPGHRRELKNGPPLAKETIFDIDGAMQYEFSSVSPVGRSRSGSSEAARRAPAFKTLLSSSATSKTPEATPHHASSSTQPRPSPGISEGPGASAQNQQEKTEKTTPQGQPSSQVDLSSSFILMRDGFTPIEIERHSFDVLPRGAPQVCEKKAISDGSFPNVDYKEPESSRFDNDLEIGDESLSYDNLLTPLNGSLENDEWEDDGYGEPPEVPQALLDTQKKAQFSNEQQQSGGTPLPGNNVSQKAVGPSEMVQTFEDGYGLEDPDVPVSLMSGGSFSSENASSLTKTSFDSTLTQTNEDDMSGYGFDDPEVPTSMKTPELLSASDGYGVDPPVPPGMTTSNPVLSPRDDPVGGEGNDPPSLFISAVAKSEPSVQRNKKTSSEISGIKSVIRRKEALLGETSARLHSSAAMAGERDVWNPKDSPLRETDFLQSRSRGYSSFRRPSAEPNHSQLPPTTPPSVNMDDFSKLLRRAIRDSLNEGEKAANEGERFSSPSPSPSPSPSVSPSPSPSPSPSLSTSAVPSTSVAPSSSSVPPTCLSLSSPSPITSTTASSSPSPPSPRSHPSDPSPISPDPTNQARAARIHDESFIESFLVKLAQSDSQLLYKIHAALLRPPSSSPALIHRHSEPAVRRTPIKNLAPRNQNDNVSSSAPVSAANLSTSQKTPSPASANQSSTYTPYLEQMSWRRWNEEFQRSFEEEEDSLPKYRRLLNLSNDFVFAAQMYGKIIISERYLPVKEKTIKPNDRLGGVAGGEKYIHQGILFKFAVDVRVYPPPDQSPSADARGHRAGCGGGGFARTVTGAGTNEVWMYGGESPSDEAAQHVAGNELRGLISFFKCNVKDLHVPLMALIDYLGFRLVAISLLPIDRSTIIYGSNDGGKTIHNSDPQFASMIKQVARELNLKGHMVRGTKIYGPGDIEAHYGRDQRYYVVDYARVFPPEAPSRIQEASVSSREKRKIFYRLLRPEFVRDNPVALSSDAFTPFQKFDRRDPSLNAAVRQATQRLYNEMIPAIAKRMDSWTRHESSEWSETVEKSLSRERSDAHLYFPMSPNRMAGKKCVPSPTQIENPNDSVPEFRLSEEIHRAGICVRHMGLLRKAVETPKMKIFLLSEMAARASKNLIRRALRLKMAEVRLPSTQAYRDVVLKHLNIIFGCQEVSQDFWRCNEKGIKVMLMEKFQNSLEVEEIQPSLDLRKRVNIRYTFQRLLQMTTIRISTRASEEMDRQPNEFEFVAPDLEALTARVKHMNIIDLNSAIVCRMEAAKKFGTEYDRLFALAEAKFMSSLASLPSCAESFYQWGRLLHGKALRIEKVEIFKDAEDKYRNSISIHNHKDSPAALYLGQCLHDLGWLLIRHALRRALSTPAPMVNSASRPSSPHQSLLNLAGGGDGGKSGKEKHMRRIGSAEKSSMKRIGSDTLLGDPHMRGGKMDNFPSETEKEEDFMETLNEGLENIAKGLHYNTTLFDSILTHAARCAQGLINKPAGSILNREDPPTENKTGEQTAPPKENTQKEKSLFEALTNPKASAKRRSLEQGWTLLGGGGGSSSGTSSGGSSSSSSSSSSKSVEIGDQNTRPLRSGKLNNPREREKKCFYVAASSLLKILLKLDPHHPAALHLASELEFVWGKEILTKIDFRKKRVNMDLVLKAADLFKRSIESRPELVSSLNSLIQASSMGEFVAFYYMYQMRNEPFAQAVLSRCTTAKDMNLTSLLKIPQPTFHSLLSLCTSLESVSLENVYQTVDETVEILCTSSHKTLRFLNLGGCFRLQVNSIKHINKMKRLQWLSLAYCDTIPFNGFMEFASNCPFSLETLDLSTALGANRITDEVIVNLARRLSTTLVSLKLSHCSQISDTALGALAKHCTNLTHLHLNRSLETADEKHLFSDKGVGLIARNHKLRYLDISFCSRLTERTLNSLYRCSELKTLNVEGCRKITQPLRERFMQNCPSVLVLPSLL